MSAPSPKVGVFTVVNDDFVPGFVCMERSLRQHNPSWKLPIHVLYESRNLPLSEENQTLIRTLCDDVIFQHVDVSQYAAIMEYASSVLQTPERLLAAFYVLDAFSSDAYDRVLCLDSDLLVCGDISSLLDIDAGFRPRRRSPTMACARAVL